MAVIRFDVSGGLDIAACGNMQPKYVIPVIQAYNIDKKIDDGVPETGNVQAALAISNSSINWNTSAWNNTDPLNCFDGNLTTFPQGGAYSINATAGNNANSPNCALSFKFQ